MTLVDSSQAVAPALLEVDSVVVSFGGVRAVAGCSFEVRAGGIVGLIGPNGAGKSTVVDTIGGQRRPDSGVIRFEGRRISGVSQHEIARRGCVRTYQVSREFKLLTTLENLILAAPERRGEHLLDALLFPRKVRRVESVIVQEALGVLEEVGLFAERDKLAGQLSGGQKRLLELGRALMTHPKLLILDEPFAGVAPHVLERLIDVLRRRNQDGLTILMVEHLFSVLESACDEVIVMAEGEVIARGVLESILKETRVMSSYLGGMLVGVGQ